MEELHDLDYMWIRTVSQIGEIRCPWDIGLRVHPTKLYSDRGGATFPTVLVMGIVEAFLEAVIGAIDDQDGTSLAILLSLPEDFTEDRYKQLLPALELMPEPVPSSFWHSKVGHLMEADEVMEELWPEALRQFLACLKMYRKAKFGSGISSKTLFGAWLGLCQTYLRILQSGGERWHLPLLYKLVDELWQVAKEADAEDPAGQCQEEAARLANKAFTICITDRNPSTESSRKWGTYRIAGLLFRIYFALGQLGLCNNALRAIGASQLPSLDQFPAPERVTYRYYLGRFYFVNERYSQALTELMAAFKECHRDATTAKRKILHLLVPTRLLVHGAIPHGDVLTRYNMDQGFYTEALQSIRTGDVLKYRSLLDEYEHDLLLMGTFLVWERLILVAYRSLFRRVWQIQSGNTRILLSGLIGVMGVEDGDEAGAMVGVLIDVGLVKGYISQERATLVLSQKEPFPPISTSRL